MPLRRVAAAAGSRAVCCAGWTSGWLRGRWFGSVDPCLMSLYNPS
jgi:hypothetical protein